MIARHANSFDALRILAALAVMVSHGGQVTSGDMGSDVLYRLSSGQMTLGALAVSAFFGMSGFLVMQSWQRRADPLAFVRARILRIWPALIVVVAATVLIVGPWLTTAPNYWQSPQTWAYWNNLLLHQPPGSWRGLPGVFGDNPLQHVINGPLWTLEYEVAAYLVLLALGAGRLLTRESVTALAAVLTLIVWRVPQADAQPWLYLMLPFSVGAALAQWRDQLPWRRDVALLALLACTAAPLTEHMHVITGVAGTYLLLHIGQGARLRGWGRWGDPSYGIYLWGMLVQQVVVGLGYGLTPANNLIIAVPLTVALAYASWHVVEQRVLALRAYPRSRLSPPVPR